MRAYHPSPHRRLQNLVSGSGEILSVQMNRNCKAGQSAKRCGNFGTTGAVLIVLTKRVHRLWSCLLGIVTNVRESITRSVASDRAERLGCRDSILWVWGYFLVAADRILPRRLVARQIEGPVAIAL